MSFVAPLVPSPQNEHAKRTTELFVVFYEEIGKWPWEVIDFGPRKWGQNLVHDFTRLLSVDLPKTENVSLTELIEYLHHNSAEHPKVQYQYQLSMMLIAKATKWLAEKRELADDSGSDSDGSILNEPQSITRNRKRARALRVANRSSRPIRSARKRPINYSDRHHFQLHNVDDSEDDGAEGAADGGNEGPQEVVELESAEPPVKRRLMVFFKFSSENTQELSRLLGPGSGNGKAEALRHSIPQQNAGRGNRRLDTPNESPNEAQLAYADHLKGEIAKVEENITRTEASINNSSRRREGYLKIVRNSAEDLEKATEEATEASQAVQHARALCEADAQVVEELRRISSDNPRILTEENFQHFKENTPAQKEKRDAENALRTKQKRLNDVKTKLQIAEANIDPLNSKISELHDVMNAKKNVRRSLVAMHRLAAMGGEEIEETLGENGLEEWLREQV
ncbi:hypothetical protein FVEG_08508 [Fusarium verticillioides 7600]|uniref:Uncharacterized protein n=1 Tax=Gibberella moniliformis (strain M3125 / FGSC 7600) TaxID=334819 RepID=W7MCV9_GIBM7|nr:hypothetical protein FVEG_08508 [Fusarium verticillioides 7600]EWG48851.1 hypothetical protein FVEG_08508 [Fusarium verticillioides 7600]